MIVTAPLVSLAFLALQPLPAADLDGLEDVVRLQLEEARAAVAALPPDAAARARAEASAFLGRLYYAYGLLDQARPCFESAERLQPGDFRWPHYLGTLDQAQGRTAEAVERLSRASSLAPDHVPSLVRAAEALLDAGRLDPAQAKLERALELDGGADPAIGALLGQAALARRDHARAAELLEAALAAAPEANRLYYPLAMAYRGLGQLDRARELLARSGAVGLKPTDPLLDGLDELRRGERAHLLRGRVAFAAGRFSDAAAEFASAVEAAPDSARARVNLGSALAELGRVDEALAQLRRALELDPPNAAARFNLGVLLGGQGRAREAVSELEAVVAAKPDDGAALRQLGRQLVAAGRLEDAAARLVRASELEPSDEEARLQAAELLVGLGRHGQAIVILETGLAQDPGAGLIAHALARLLATGPDPGLRDGARSLELAQRVFAARRSVEHAETLALALAEAGQCEQADRLAREAVAAARRSDGELARELRARLESFLTERRCRVTGMEQSPGDGRTPR